MPQSNHVRIILLCIELVYLNHWCVRNTDFINHNVTTNLSVNQKNNEILVWLWQIDYPWAYWNNFKLRKNVNRAAGHHDYKQASINVMADSEKGLIS